ncbi:MAG: hypothetical protein P8X55_13870 [Desulfosarcinaceae bacterium]
MSHKTKIIFTDRKAAAQRKLSARIERLEAAGIDQAVILKDTAVRKFKADVRHAARKLSLIADQEKLIENRAGDKAAKLAAAKQPAKAAPPSSPKPKKQKKAKTAE